MSKAEKRKADKEIGSFEDEIWSREKAFVLFYATWCPFSQRFLPVFEKYSKDHPEECLQIIVDDKPYFCEEYSIEYYPTVILFSKGKVQKRLDARPGIGLDEDQLKDFTGNK